MPELPRIMSMPIVFALGHASAGRFGGHVFRLISEFAELLTAAGAKMGESIGGKMVEIGPAESRGPGLVFDGSKTMKSLSLILMVVVVAGLSGCNQVRNEDAGMVVGGVLGGFLGSQIGDGTGQLAATAAGALAGALIGGSIGRSMDDLDRMRQQDSLEQVPTGHTNSWRNPDTGHEYAVTPTRTYETRGTYCREYTTEAWIGGKKESVYGEACRQPDGSWKTI